VEVKCSFNSLIGSPCSHDPRDRNKSTDVILFLNCNRDIAGHKSFLSIPDVEIELILTREGIFSSTELNLSDLTICPQHHASLGVGIVKYHRLYQNMTNKKGQRQREDLAKINAV